MKASEPAKMSGGTHWPFSATAQSWMSRVSAPWECQMEQAGEFREVERAAQAGDAAFGPQIGGDAFERLEEGVGADEARQRLVVENAFLFPRVGGVEMADEGRDQPLDQPGGQDVAEREAAPETVAAVVDHVAPLAAVLFVADHPDDGAPRRDVLAAHAGREAAEVVGRGQLLERGVGAGRVHLPLVHRHHEAELLGAGDPGGIDAVFDVVFRAKAVEPRVEGRMGAEPQVADPPDVGEPVHGRSVGSSVWMKPRSRSRR